MADLSEEDSLERFFFIAKKTHLSAGWIILAVCVTLYCLYFAVLSNEARTWFPFWGLCSAPLLGYPIYLGDIIRKDVYLLLSLLATAKIIGSSKPSIGNQLLIAFIGSLAILSHEIYLFLGVPVCLLVNTFSIYKVYSKRPIQVYFLTALGWALPLACGLSVLRSSGTQKQALKILDSLSTITSIPSLSAPPGALAWLGRTSQEAISITFSHLSLTHFRIPLWALVIMAMVLAATVITLLFNSPHKRSGFAFYFLIQTFFMSPIFISAIDQGRWIFLTINSAFIYTLLLPCLPMGGILNLISVNIERLRLVTPPAICVFVLLIWSFPVVSFWGFKEWLDSIPLTFLLGKLYFYMRVHGAIPAVL
jgi:hypothetical protein